MKRFVLLLVAATLSTGTILAQAAQGGGPNYGPIKSRLTGIFAYQANGSREPGKDQECRQRYANFLGSSMTTNFNTEPAHSSAKSTWAVQGFSDVNFDLHPLGVAGTYSYGNWYRKTFNGKEVYGVTFSARRSGAEPTAPYSSTVSFIATPNLTCALTNPMPAKKLIMENKAQ